jgi:membrane fusion protein, multidrug efflux system
MRLTLSNVAVLVLFSLLIIACSKKKQDNTSARNTRPSGPITVDAFSVQPHMVSDNIEVSGSLLPFEETQIRSEVSGRIIQLNVQEGAIVKGGTLMVKLFDRDLQAQLKKLEVQLQIKEKTSERNRELLSINGISQQEYDLSTLDVDNLKADIETTKINIGKTEIRAPYTGSVGLRNVSLGSYLSPSDIITTIRQIDKLKLEFSVPEKYAKDIVKGYVVKFKVDGGKDYHKATVMATENRVDQNTRTLRIRAVVDESHPELVPGIFAKINLQLGKDTHALMVPTQAIIPQARGKQVILLRKDSAQFIDVETGIRDSAYVQVTSGLQEGDTVITSGLMSIRPNAKVKVTKVNRYQ